jgi:epoxyqueuosine reductase
MSRTALALDGRPTGRKLQMTDFSRLTQAIKQESLRIGFSSVGICPAVTPTGFHRLSKWLERGYGGEMHYLAGRQPAYEHPRSVLDGVRSLVMLTLNYDTESPRPIHQGQGKISRYAWGDVDYHDRIHDKLRQLMSTIHDIEPTSLVRGVVDTAPLMEREFAQMAGLGWIGKHTLLLNQSVGSWFFLAALLTDLELDYDDPSPTDHCGTCTACLDACPTNAFPEPYVLDATRCISYLTIELRSQIPLRLRSGIDNWLFGCDVCQEVCPWNRHAPQTAEADFAPQAGHNPVNLVGLFELDDDAFRARFRHTPLWRAKRRGVLRNAAVVLGNQRSPDGFTALCCGLADGEPLVRGACAWALGQYGDERADDALRRRLATELDEQVITEIKASLSCDA